MKIILRIATIVQVLFISLRNTALLFEKWLGMEDRRKR